MGINTTKPARLLVVSTEPSTLGPLWSVGEANAWSVEIADSGFDALDRVQSGNSLDLILLDMGRSESDGFHTLRWLRRIRPDLAVILFAYAENSQHRVEAIRLGAQEYVVKPVDGPQLEALVRRCVGISGNGGLGNEYFGDSIERFGDGLLLVAASPVMRKLRGQAELLAQVDVPLLITGENGSGKETAARLIHELSSRAAFGFHRVNCAALLGDLLERELFGYEPGAFPTAIRSKPGKLEVSDKGTLLLDDITEMPARLQAKLLHVLQEQEFFRLGGDMPISAHVRIIAATSANLDQALATKKLREDLYYRLSAFTVHVPPLRQRKDEIPLLLEQFMAQLAAQYGLPARKFSRATLDACQAYAWPGNLRELEGLVKRYLVMGDEDLVLAELRRMPENLWATPEISSNAHIDGQEPEEHVSGLRSLVQSVKGEAEKNAISVALEQTHWNRKAAARLLKVSYRTLLYKIQHYHMSPPPAYASPGFSGGGLKDES
ncbi:MAG TPA: sigma-54 dependent transcriptional regulator [Terriglobales bacterium]